LGGKPTLNPEPMGMVRPGCASSPASDFPKLIELPDALPQREVTIAVFRAPISKIARDLFPFDRLIPAMRVVAVTSSWRDWLTAVVRFIVRNRTAQPLSRGGNKLLLPVEIRGEAGGFRHGCS
jgi:hypothetical protein